ncbi:MAG: hypothetical protein EON93_01425 [Burkholderiales bacterium]|nr:MAG: hypothetical protein EON93_01425 [Burkholderiales bacterium]
MLQKSDLEALVRAVQEDPESADSHMLELNRQRARSLLEADSSESEFEGCSLARSIPTGGEWVILRQLELGQAAVVADGTSTFAPRVYVRYFGAGGKFGGGHISVFLPGMRRAIYSLPWWMT